MSLPAHLRSHPPYRPNSILRQRTTLLRQALHVDAARMPRARRCGPPRRLHAPGPPCAVHAFFFVCFLYKHDRSCKTGASSGKGNSLDGLFSRPRMVPTSIKPYGPLNPDPTSSCFHHCPNVFEGLKVRHFLLESHNDNALAQRTCLVGPS